jgi:hypothetical protein
MHVIYVTDTVSIYLISFNRACVSNVKFHQNSARASRSTEHNRQAKRNTDTVDEDRIRCAVRSDNKSRNHISQSVEGP